MRCVLPLLVLAAGCAGTDELPPDPHLRPTADRRELELKQNLRPGLTWDEHERRMAEAKAAFGPGSDGDATGPGKANPGR